MIDLKQLTSANTLEFWVKIQNEESQFKLEACLFTKKSQGYFISQDKVFSFASLRNKEEQNDLDFQLQSGCAYLACIENIAKDHSLQIRLIFFSGPLLNLGHMTIFNSSELINFDPQELIEDCTLKVGTDSYVLIMQEDSDNFVILGEHSSVSIELKQFSNNEAFLQLAKCSGKLSTNLGGVRLCSGTLNFSDLSNPKNMCDFASTQLAHITKSQGSYLKAWDRYSLQEGKLLLEKARQVGALPFNNFVKNAQGITFYLAQECPEALSEGDFLSVVEEVPLFLTDVNLSWEEYYDLQEQNFKKSKENKASSLPKKAFRFIGEISKLHPKALELKLTTDGLPPERGFLVFSVEGDLTQMERRFKARRQIKESKCANPLLGLILEEDGVLPKSSNKKEHIEAITPLVREKIFKHPPTLMQEKAIEIALNTPDLALIQGPPGTGKTTVIAAIAERLNELIDPAKIRGSILVTAFQHDAVDNVVGRLSLNAMPTIKFGRRSGDDLLKTQLSIAKWREDLIEKIPNKHPKLKTHLQVQKVRDAFVAYLSLPSLEKKEAFLNACEKLPAIFLSPNVQDKLYKLDEKLRQETLQPKILDTKHLLRYVYALRDDPQTYADDGLYTAAQAITLLSDFLEESDKDLLLSCNALSDPNYFEHIKALKLRLFEKLKPEKAQTSPKPQNDVIELMETLEHNFTQVHEGSEVEKIVSDFLYDVENNPQGVQQALEDCNTVFASTVQQSQGREISKAKRRMTVGSAFEDKAFYYDTVIVDEAARTSPLDLLIPLSQARNRIILVGDHKQLPHIIDEEIARKLESENKEVDLESIYKKSMFEYLFERLQKLTAQDGIERTVTLDAQYRMHPLLGDFVSRAFYEGQVKSPLGVEYFKQDLEGTDGKAALWLEVPLSLGKENKYGTSRQREAEARAIVKLLKLWLGSKQGSKLSFGVISFYKAQAQLINKIAFEEEILEQDQISVKDAFKGEGVDLRLRINTVDAFQGMEFDVVFLSMVRSIDWEHSPFVNKDPNETQVQSRLFGHLMSKNRLCVALSRQKRLLIIAGDHHMLECPAAKLAVPELQDFYKLCCDQGKVISGGLK